MRNDLNLILSLKLLLGHSVEHTIILRCGKETNTLYYLSHLQTPLISCMYTSTKNIQYNLCWLKDLVFRLHTKLRNEGVRWPSHIYTNFIAFHFYMKNNPYHVRLRGVPIFYYCLLNCEIRKRFFFLLLIYMG